MVRAGGAGRVDLVTGTVTLGPAAGLAAEAVPAANGYWRVALTAPTLGDLWTPGASQDLLGWWDLADAGTLTINASQRVLAVADKSGRGVPLTASAAEAPTFGATTINGKPAATFGGTQVLRAGNSTSFLPALDGQQVFVALVVVASEGIIYGDRAGNGVAFHLNFFSGNLSAAAYDYSLAFSSTPWAGAGAGPAIIVQKFDLGAPAAGRQFIQINGGPDVGANTASGAFTGPPAEHLPVTVGNWNATFTNEGLRGSIAEYVIGRSWDDVVRAVGYLAHKWWGAGAANPLPASHPYKESPPTITAARVGRMDLLMTASGTATGAYTGGGTAGLDLWGVQFERNDQVGAYLRSEGTAAQGEIGGDGMRGWTDNAALVIAEEIRFHGKELDWDEVAEEADICDQLVTNRTGGVQRRWTINGTLDDEMEWEQVRADLAEACDAFFYERPDGRVGFKVGRWIEPTVTLTARDFLSLRVAENDWGPDTSGEFVMRYVEPSRDYQETPSGVYVVDPGGVRTVAESFLVHSHNQAARLLKRLATVSRPQYSISGTIKMIGYDCIGQRFLRIDHEDLGLMITVEVAKLVREADGISFTLDAISVDPTDFGFDAAVEEPLPQSFYAVEQTAEVAPPAALAGLAVEGGGGVAQIEYSWGPQHVSLRQELRYRPVGQGEEAWQYETMGRGQISRVITGLVDGTTYEAQLRNVTAAGRTSPWTVLIEVLAVANSTAPAGLSGVSVAKAGSVVNLSWTNPNDGNFQAVRIYRAAGATPFSGAALVRTEFGAPGAADSWQDTTPGTGSVSYWLEPINGSGVAGPRVGPQSVTI